MRCRAAYVLLFVAAIGLVIPPPVLLAASQSRATVLDLALRDGGVMQGQLTDQQGVVQVGQEVVLEYQGQQIARTRTDAQGAFAFTNLRGGMYILGTPTGKMLVRAWAVNTAPPKAGQDLLLVTGDVAARGQLPGTLTQWGLGTLVIAAGVAGVVVVTRDRDPAS